MSPLPPLAAAAASSFMAWAVRGRSASVFGRSVWRGLQLVPVRPGGGVKIAKGSRIVFGDENRRPFGGFVDSLHLLFVIGNAPPP